MTPPEQSKTCRTCGHTSPMSEEEKKKKIKSDKYFDDIERICSEQNLNFNSAHDRWMANYYLENQS